MACMTSAQPVARATIAAMPARVRRRARTGFSLVSAVVLPSRSRLPGAPAAAARKAPAAAAGEAPAAPGAARRGRGDLGGEPGAERAAVERGVDERAREHVPAPASVTRRALRDRGRDAARADHPVCGAERDAVDEDPLPQLERRRRIVLEPREVLGPVRECAPARAALAIVGRQA